MTISLTRDEFLQRLKERRKLFIASVNHDIEPFTHDTNNPLTYVRYKGGMVEINKFIQDLVDTSIYRAIDLVYHEGLD